MKSLLKTLIKIYQRIFSPVLGRSCRYVPSCSSYALDAVEKHGALKGVCLILGRILSCHPFSKRTLHDPVPGVFTWRACLGYKAPTHKQQ